MEEKKKKVWLSIRQRMVTSYLLLVAIIFLMGVLGVWNIYRVYTNGSVIYSHYLKGVETMKSINQNLREIDRDLLLLSGEDNQEAEADYVFDVLDLQTKNEELLQSYREDAQTEEEKHRCDECEENVDAFNAYADEILRLAESGDMAGAANAYNNELAATRSGLFSMTDTMVDEAVQSAEEKDQENERIFNQILIASIVIGVLAVAAAFIIALWMSNYFNRRLASIRNLAKRLAEYDISDDLQSGPADELGETMQALNESQFRIRKLLESVADEAATMGEMGTDISRALRKSEERLSAASMTIVRSFRMAEGMDTAVTGLLSSGDLNETSAGALREVLQNSDTAREMLNDTCGELASITKFLEQIAVTTDYQNEMAAAYREKIGRFKLKSDTAPEAHPTAPAAPASEASDKGTSAEATKSSEEGTT